MLDMYDFWEEKHTEEDICWLSDSGIDAYRLLGCGNILEEKGLRVMEIGVGTGNQIRHLSSLHSVISVDICNKALQKVSDCSEVCLVKDMCIVPDCSVDIAVSFLVFQHCDGDMFDFLIKNVIRVLKTNGVFFFQTASIPDIDRVLSGEIKCEYKWGKKGIIPDFYKNEIGKTHFFRDVEEVKTVVERYGEVLSVSDPIIYADHCNITWNYISCKRQRKIL